MLHFRAASTDPADGELIRQIRNSGRQWMTRDAREIGRDEQRTWWARRDAAAVPIWIASIAATPIGYGLLRADSERTWCSLAVLPRERGRGYGSAIYTFLAHATAADVYAEILADNTPSIRACLRAGYQIAYALDRMAVLVYRKG